MPRRRVYIINLEDILREPAPPSRIRPFLRLAALALAVTGFGVAIIQFIAALVPEVARPSAVTVFIGYAMVILLFFSQAKRINHH